MLNELMLEIMATGEKTVVQSEPVPMDLTRPVVIHYTSDKGTVVETWEYVPGNQWQADWGAIHGVYYSYLPPQNPVTEEIN